MNAMIISIIKMTTFTIIVNNLKVVKVEIIFTIIIIRLMVANGFALIDY